MRIYTPTLIGLNYHLENPVSLRFPEYVFPEFLPTFRAQIRLHARRRRSQDPEAEKGWESCKLVG